MHAQRWTPSRFRASGCGVLVVMGLTTLVMCMVVEGVTYPANAYTHDDALSLEQIAEEAERRLAARQEQAHAHIRDSALGGNDVDISSDEANRGGGEELSFSAIRKNVERKLKRHDGVVKSRAVLVKKCAECETFLTHMSQLYPHRYPGKGLTAQQADRELCVRLPHDFKQSCIKVINMYGLKQCYTLAMKAPDTMCEQLMHCRGHAPTGRTTLISDTTTGHPFAPKPAKDADDIPPWALKPPPGLGFGVAGAGKTEQAAPGTVKDLPANWKPPTGNIVDKNGKLVKAKPAKKKDNAKPKVTPQQQRARAAAGKMHGADLNGAMDLAGLGGDNRIAMLHLMVGGPDGGTGTRTLALQDALEPPICSDPDDYNCESASWDTLQQLQQNAGF